jgi:hypothetical protein
MAFENKTLLRFLTPVAIHTTSLKYR